MKIVVVSDLHGDWSTLGVPRYDEIVDALSQALEHATQLKIRDGERVAFLCLGDVADPDNGGATIRAQQMAIEAALDLSSHGIRSYWVVGNHDVCEDGSGASVLSPLESVAYYDKRVRVASAPVSWEIDEDLHLLCLPFVPASHGVDVAERTRVIWPASGRVVVAAHLSVPGIVPGEETLEMPRGREIVFPFEETKRAVLRLNGHIHKRQIFDPGDGGPPIVIPGSLARLTFGEETHEPGFLVLDVPTAP